MRTLDAAGDEGLLSEVTNDRQRLNRFKKWFDQATRANQEWRADAIESREFVSGKQWREADQEARRKARRPLLVINKVLPRVLFLTGLQRSQREEPKLLPFEGGDARSAELMGALYKWCGTRCREAVVDSAVFTDKIVTGLGFWKVGWRFEGDPEGDLQWERVDPLSVFPDPNWLDSGWDHAEYVIQATWMTLADAMEEWSEKADELRHVYGEWLSETTSATQTQGGGDFAGDSFSGERSYWDPETQRLRVLEVWYKKRVKVDAAMRTDTGEMTTEPDRVAFLKQAVAAQPELEGAFSFLRMPVTKICVAHVTSELVLDDQPSPYRPQTFPLFPTVGYYWWRTPFGIVTPLKDLNREKNVRRSTIIEMIQRASLSGWFNQESSGAKREDLENYAAGVGKVIPFKQVRPEQIPPPELPQAIVYLDTSADRDMDSVSNIHAELLGTSTQRTVSGRAINARQQSGLVVQEPMLESFRQDKEPGVRFAVGLLQQFTSPPKALRILGSIAVRAPQGDVAQQMQGMALVEVQELLRGAMNEEYDTVISSQPYDPSRNKQRMDTLMEIAQQFPQFTPPDVLIDAAKSAGVLTEDQAARFQAFVQEQMAMQQQMAAASAGGAPPGGTPAPMPQALTAA